MNWEKPVIDQDQVKELAAKYGCDLLSAAILVRRGWLSGDDLRFFLETDPRHLRDPFTLSGLEEAVERLLTAKEAGEKVLVYGDRDVDGITSTALMVETLSDLGIAADWRLPQADEAYGLSSQAVKDFADAAGSLIVTVDCGVSNLDEIALAATYGIDVIVVDHHNPPAKLPAALAIINPKLPGSNYAFRDLAGCAVVYKLACALRWADKSQIFGQSICLLDARPLNDSYLVEAVKFHGLRIIDRLAETIVPGVTSIEHTRLFNFLQNQQIMVWNAALQRRTLAKLFGPTIDFQLLDTAPEIGKLIPAVAGISLLRVKELSKIARYSDKPLSEIDVFINLFISFIHKKEHFQHDKDAEALQLAALGTLADLMPLRDENRLLVRLGLAAMAEKPRSGIADLLYKVGLAGRRFSANDLAWQLCPLINATGRMGQPDLAVQLLLQTDAEERDRLADQIVSLNEERKNLGAVVWSVVEPMARQNLKTYQGKLALAFGEEIHRGVTGIMAGRLAKLLKIPAMVIAFTGPESAVGSLRSALGYDLRGLLEQCADLFSDWGGHDFAAGFSLQRTDWTAFLERLANISANIELPATNEESLRIDAELPLTMLGPELLKIVDLFEPFGEENEPLIFMAKGLRIDDLSLMGKTEVKHVKLCLNSGKYRWPAVYWQAAPKVKQDFDLHDTVDLAFRITRNYFNGIETPQLVINDLKRA